ncbi:MAG: ferritin-like domain-containing protein [Candidatus Omnitrophica bacterium]|nr:ferritin-like domain-containing protein [Candidatus Omnitrophota bacterium]
MQPHQIIYNLNKALEIEYTEIFLYAREASSVREIDGALSSLFEKFGLMEVRHADLLSRRILELGGVPAWEYSLPSVDPRVKSVIAHHIDLEAKAIDFYGKLIGQVDEETKILLRGIRAEEEEHLFKLRDYPIKNI